jgi:hypothetical protein
MIVVGSIVAGWGRARIGLGPLAGRLVVSLRSGPFAIAFGNRDVVEVDVGMELN